MLRNLRQIRQARRFSQSQLACATGIPQPQISRLERGLTPRLDELIAVARALDVSQEALIARAITFKPDGTITVVEGVR